MKRGSARRASSFDAMLVDAVSEQAGYYVRPERKGRTNLVRANAEAGRIHQLVVKLNIEIERAAENGLGTNLVVRGGAPGSPAILEVRTTFDLLEATADVLDGHGSANRHRAPGIEAHGISGPMGDDT